MIKLKEWQENKIQAVLNVFEGSEPNETKYDGVYIFPDGKGGRRQVTLGIGFTEDSWSGGGSLGAVLNIYVTSQGKYAGLFAPYLKKIGTGTLHKDEVFKNLLKTAAQNDVLFCDCQDHTYKALYVYPARYIADDLDLTLALSVLVVQDSKLHGSFDTVRGLFRENPPSKGGDEKAWVKAYCTARRTWWMNHPKNPWRGQEGKATYRMDCFLDAINKGNWELNLPINTNGVKI